MKNRLIIAVLAMLALGWQLSAGAAEPYFQANVGATSASTSGSSDWSPTIEDKSKFVWSVGAGLKFNETVAVEAAYSDFGKYSASGPATGIFTPTGVLVTTRSGTGEAHVQGPSLSLVLSFGKESFDPHVKVGAFYDTDSHTATFTRADTGAQESTESSNKVGLIAGIGATINKHFTVDYTYLQETNVWAGKDLAVQSLTVGYKF